MATYCQLFFVEKKLTIHHRSVHSIILASHMCVVAIKNYNPANAFFFVPVSGKLVKKKSNNQCIMALTFVWIGSMTSLALNWINKHDAFVMHNGSPYEITIALRPVGTARVAFALPSIVSSVLADGILVRDADLF